MKIPLPPKYRKCSNCGTKIPFVVDIDKCGKCHGEFILKLLNSKGKFNIFSKPK